MLKTTLAAFALTLAAAPAYAGAFSFDYKHYELETAGGVNALFDHLENRVDRYCTTSDRKPLSIKAAEKLCVSQTLEEAVQQINDPRLSRVYAQKFGAADYAETGSRSDY